jgi:hypothetical protein
MGTKVISISIPLDVAPGIWRSRFIAVLLMVLTFDGAGKPLHLLQAAPRSVRLLLIEVSVTGLVRWKRPAGAN